MFPYEYVNLWNRLDESQLPPKHKFYYNLTNEEISEEDYIRAMKVWNKFNIKSLGEYSDLYLTLREYPGVQWTPPHVLWGRGVLSKG